MSEKDVWNILRARKLVSQRVSSAAEYTLICTYLTKYQLDTIALSTGHYVEEYKTAALTELFERATGKKRANIK